MTENKNITFSPEYRFQCLRTNDNKILYMQNPTGFDVFDTNEASLISKIVLPNIENARCYLSYDDKYIIITNRYNKQYLNIYDIEHKKCFKSSIESSDIIRIVSPAKNAYLLCKSLNERYSLENTLYVNGVKICEIEKIERPEFIGDHLYYLSYEDKLILNKINIYTAVHNKFTTSSYISTSEDTYIVTDKVVLIKNRKSGYHYNVSTGINTHFYNFIYCTAKYIITLQSDTNLIYELETGNLVKKITPPFEYFKICGDVFIGVLGFSEYSYLYTKYYIPANYIIYIYNIATNETSYIYTKFSLCNFAQYVHLSNNYKYLISIDNNHDIKFNALPGLFNNDKKISFLMGKHSEESSIYKMTKNELFDEHLFGEILGMLKNSVELA
jgi:hypothetical protein